MSEFINVGLVIMSGFLVFVGLIILTFDEKGDKSYGFFIVTIMMFLFTLFGAPYMEYQKAQKNIKYFNDGKILKCYSSVGALGGSEIYMVANDQWKREQFNFIKNDNRLVIRANHCEY